MKKQKQYLICGCGYTVTIDNYKEFLKFKRDVKAIFKTVQKIEQYKTDTNPHKCNIYEFIVIRELAKKLNIKFESSTNK